MKGDELRPPAVFTGLVDLAAQALGAHTLGTSDDFFASVDNLILPGRGEWREHAYTDRGKWMDGWESRRKRGGAPFDWAILELGARGLVRGFNVDTNHFTGNHPAFAAVDLAALEPGAAPELEAIEWREVLPPTPLAGGAQNLLIADSPSLATHARLRIYPDGGVARFRVYGEVRPRWPALDEQVDLVALVNGGRARACSDMFFSPMANAISPGDPKDMGGGWETRRRRGPGHDWLILELGARGIVERLELDTLFFKGNYPARASLWALDAPGASTPELVAPGASWRMLLDELALGPDARHAFELPAELRGAGAPSTHLRLEIAPDGGISRMRALGRRVP